MLSEYIHKYRFSLDVSVDVGSFFIQAEEWKSIAIKRLSHMLKGADTY